MPKKPNQTPNWQPISALPLIAQMIDGNLTDVEEQFQNLQPARSRPHVLDDATVERIIKVYTEQKDFLWVYDKQLARWKAESLTPTQRREVERLEAKLGKLRTVLDAILDLADQLKERTIERVLGKSDIEVALDVLSGKWEL